MQQMTKSTKSENAANTNFYGRRSNEFVPTNGHGEDFDLNMLEFPS